MELIKWILMIAGILAFLIIGCMILLRSDEKKRSRTKQYQENIDMLNETNEMLDTTLMELESYNAVSYTHLIVLFWLGKELNRRELFQRGQIIRFCSTIIGQD